MTLKPEKSHVFLYTQSRAPDESVNVLEVFKFDLEDVTGGY